MGTETLAGKRHRRGMLWVMTGLGCERSRVQIPRITPILKVSVSNDHVPKGTSFTFMASL